MFFVCGACTERAKRVEVCPGPESNRQELTLTTF